MLAWWRATITAAIASAAITEGKEWPRSSAPIGTQAAARIEPSDTQRKLIVTASQTAAAGTTAPGTSRRSAPSPVATPLPPRKPRKADQQLPMTAATAQAAGAPASPPDGPPTSVAPNATAA